MNRPKKVAILTAGGLAPCLSSAVGSLIERYTEIDPTIEIICYRSGYKGLLLGDGFNVAPEIRGRASILQGFGGSPIGNSRVKLTNVKDCLKRGLIKEGQCPEKVAADQLVKDGVDVLHTVGGDDTNTAAADPAAFLGRNNSGLTVIGLPKTIDNDVYPIQQSLGAWTAAEQGARYFARHDEDRGGVLRAIEFARIKGGKPFNIDTPWFEELLNQIGQAKGARLQAKH
jgi:diphosphate-dependent phosphofructokinase